MPTKSRKGSARAKKTTAKQYGCYGNCKDSLSQNNSYAYPYRVFISYSHLDAPLALKLKIFLRTLGLLPIADHEIRIGESFSEEIKEMIECAHVFMPLVTPTANKRLWVHQEIGYANALQVPVCPIAIGKMPSGMNSNIQGIHISSSIDELPDLKTKAKLTGPIFKGVLTKPETDYVMGIIKDRIKHETIHDLVTCAQNRPRQGRFDCAKHWSERQSILVTLTESARKNGCKLLKTRDRKKLLKPDIWRLRQRTAFGSFSIPDAGVKSDIWNLRDPNRYYTEQARRLLRSERIAMTKYMSCFGCDLIIDPRVALPEQIANLPEGKKSKSGKPLTKENVKFKHNELQTALRIRLLVDLITNVKVKEKLRVVIPPTPGTLTTNLNIAGDWFATEAVVPLYGSAGYERTMFTRHAPTVLNMIDRFDQDFRDCLPGAVINSDTIKNAKESALAKMNEWLNHIYKILSADQKRQLAKACSELGIK